jgi:AraC-like DNA-binding protein
MIEPGLAAEHHCIPSWRQLPRTLDHYTLWFLRGGVAALRCSEDTYALAAGDILLVPPGLRHSATHDPARPLWVIIVHFTCERAHRKEFSLPPEGAPPLHRRLLEPHVFDPYLSRIVALRALQPPGWQAIIAALIATILAEWQREELQATSGGNARYRAYPILTQALLRLDSEGRYDARPSSLAAGCGFSPGHFGRLFRQQFGRTPQQYLLQRRIERARYLLLESDLSVRQIAQTLAYRDVYFFTRQFKGTVGQPPAAFRRAARSPASFLDRLP